MDSSESASTTEPTAASPQRLGRIGPDHLDLYVLILGIAAGVLLGPSVLGHENVAPDVYQRWFHGAGGQADLALNDFDQRAADTLQKLTASGVTEAAVQEEQARLHQERQGLINAFTSERAGYMTRLDRRMTGLIAAIILFMVIESLIDPNPARRTASIRNRLATARYALMAIWLAMVLARAQPVPVGFVLLLAVVGLVAALAPLGWLRGSKAAD